MGYSNKTLIENIIAQALLGTPKSTNAPIDLMSIGNTLAPNNTPEKIVNQYVLWADEEINSTLSQMYATPFAEVVALDTTLFANIDAYNHFIVTEFPTPLNVGDEILLKSGDTQERHIISLVVDTIGRNIFQTLEPIGFGFQAGTRMVTVKYPEPISLISAMIAASRIYDRFFSSQSDVNDSKFGQNLRAQARRELNNILNGRTILHGVHRIGGTGFYNPTLVRQYGLQKGNDGAKDIDDLGRS